MKTILTQVYQSPIGELIIGELDGKICLCDWRYRKQRSQVDQRLKTYFQTDFVEGDSTVLQSCKEQLDQYFAKERETFQLTCAFAGTDFQQSVWNELQLIPYGTTSTYLSLSKKLGNTKAIRAVASANGANALSILIPCHRIIGTDGSLTGYAGGLTAKKKLLELERALPQMELIF